MSDVITQTKALEDLRQCNANQQETIRSFREELRVAEAAAAEMREENATLTKERNIAKDARDAWKHALEQRDKDAAALRAEIARKDAALRSMMAFARLKFGNLDPDFNVEFSKAEAALSPAAQEQPNTDSLNEVCADALTVKKARIVIGRDGGAVTGFVVTAPSGEVTIINQRKVRYFDQIALHGLMTGQAALTSSEEQPKMETRATGNKPRTISEVCEAEPGALQKHLEEQKAAGGPEALVAQQYRDLIPGVDVWKEGDEMRYTPDSEWIPAPPPYKEETLDEESCYGRRPLPESAPAPAIPEGWMQNGDKIHRIGDGAWIVPSGAEMNMEEIGIGGVWIPANSGSASEKDRLYRLPWPPANRQGTLDGSSCQVSLNNSDAKITFDDFIGWVKSNPDHILVSGLFTDWMSLNGSEIHADSPWIDQPTEPGRYRLSEHDLKPSMVSVHADYDGTLYVKNDCAASECNGQFQGPLKPREGKDGK